MSSRQAMIATISTIAMHDTVSPDRTILDRKAAIVSGYDRPSLAGCVGGDGFEASVRWRSSTLFQPTLHVRVYGFVRRSWPPAVQHDSPVYEPINHESPED